MKISSSDPAWVQNILPLNRKASKLGLRSQDEGSYQSNSQPKVEGFPELTVSLVPTEQHTRTAAHMLTITLGAEDHNRADPNFLSQQRRSVCSAKEMLRVINGNTEGHHALCAA